jgi:hypothetical protein
VHALAAAPDTVASYRGVSLRLAVEFRHKPLLAPNGFSRYSLARSPRIFPAITVHPDPTPQPALRPLTALEMLLRLPRPLREHAIQEVFTFVRLSRQ